jgi:hypothetical protein
VTSALGSTDAGSQYEALDARGGRSFSIWS